MRSPPFTRLLLLLAATTGLACGSTTEPALPNGDVLIRVDASNLGAAGLFPNPFSERFAVRSKVIWVNGDRTSNGYGGTIGVTHRLVSNTAGLFDSGNLLPGRTFEFTFAAAGSYPFHCSIHPAMVGTIDITP